MQFMILSLARCNLIDFKLCCETVMKNPKASLSLSSAHLMFC